jgi:hypothetical protein
MTSLAHGNVPLWRRSHLPVPPTTRLGRWAVALAGAHVLLMAGWRLLGPLGEFPGLVCGLAGGTVGLVAILRRGERALSVFASVLPLLLVLAFVAAELLVGHD